MVIKLGVIGLSANQQAWATAAHLAPLRQKPLSDQYQLRAVGTSSTKTAKVAAKAYGLAEDKAYDRSEAIANDGDIDMVVVSVKLPLHHQLTMPVLEAKKDVFVEWPLGATTAQAEEMAALAKKQGVKNIVDLQARVNPVVQKAKEIIESGALGRITNTTVVASMSHLMNPPEQYAYVNDPKSGANFVSIPAAHIIDPLCYLLGEFKWLSASLAIKYPTLRIVRADGSLSDPIPRTFADSISLHGILETGPIVSFSLNSTGLGNPDHLMWIIAGDKASLKIEGNSAAINIGPDTKLSLYEPLKDGAGGMGWKDVEVKPVMAFGGVGEVYRAFAEGGEGLVDFEEAVKRQKMVDAIFRSAEKGTRESYV